MSRLATLAIVAALLVAARPGPALAVDAPVPAKEAAARMTVPDGFKVTLFAGEPDLVQPIAFAFDDRGRLWVVENHSYPGLLGKPEDRVLIFEDVDNDGRFDRKTVFWEEGRNLSGINLGYGGVWLCSTPELVFIPDANRDDRPDGPPEVILDGWDLEAKHNVFNSPTWGPDGWLYGCNGIMSNSKVGRPGAPDADRTPINCGVWRYHPTRKTFEAVLHGMTNPWGLDFDRHGQIFLTNCVIRHAWHGIPGANFERMYGQPFNPHLYGLMAGPSDHIHWDTAETWSDIRASGVTPTTDRAGGGHAHSGAMIYQGENWPAEYRGNLFTCNIHGNRVNRDRVERKGSGYVVRHADDFLNARDPWFRGISIQYGPDGGVYVADWSDTGECHDYDDVRRDNGRIYKITYGDPKSLPFDLATKSNQELFDLALRGKNEWQVRHARRILAERTATRGRLQVSLLDDGRQVPGSDDPDRQLKAVWTYHALGRLQSWKLVLSLDAEDEWERAWAVRLLVDARVPVKLPATTLARFATLARSDPSPVVRLALASALQRLAIADRWEVATALAARGDDAADANLPLMIWYAIEPMVAADPDAALKLAASAEIPLIRRYIARRFASLAR